MVIWYKYKMDAQNKYNTKGAPISSDTYGLIYDQGKNNIGIKLYYSNFPNGENSFFKRGGNYNNDTDAGLFYFNNNNGNSNINNGFRVALVVGQPDFDFSLNLDTLFLGTN